MNCTYCGTHQKLHRHGTTDPGFSFDITEQPKPIYACQSCDPIFPRNWVIYRTGGTKNFRWHKIKFGTEAEANQAKYEMILAGRPARNITEQDLRHGLPDIYGEDVTRWQIDDARKQLA